MKISQLLNEAEDLDSKDLKPSQQLLPPAAEEPDADQPPSEDDDLQANIEKFKKIAASIGDDLYSFTSLKLFQDWYSENVPYLSGLLADIDLPGIDEHIDAMRSANGAEGNMTFVILNARTGEVTSIGFGNDAESQGVDMGELDPDQKKIQRELLKLYDKYEAAINSAEDDSGESTKSSNIRSQILHSLNYMNQPQRRSPEEDEEYRRATYRSPEEEQELQAYARKKRLEREARKAAAKTAIIKNKQRG